jgi:putative ABC transport system permease protein
MNSVLFDVRFAVRSLRRRPVFAAVAIATIAIAIGAVTAIYSIVDGVLFRSLPFHDSGRIVAVWQTDSVSRGQPLLAAGWDRAPLDYTGFLVWRDQQTSFDGVGVWTSFESLIPGAHGPELVDGLRVSPGLFELLGVHPVLGRTFLPGEDVLGGPHVTMVSYETWQSRFGGRGDVIGSSISLWDLPFTIVGVLPRGFTLERGKPGAPYWIPAGQDQGDVGANNHSFQGIGRLKHGVTIEQATMETARLLGSGQTGTRSGARIEGFVRDETRDVRAPLFILLGAVALLLAIACVNVATLLLGEAMTRDVEMSARVALGASRGRIVRQLLTESLLLSAAGATVGALLAWWGTKAMVALAPPGIPGIGLATVDGRVLAVTVASAAVTGVLFGLAPALTLSESSPATLLRAGRTVRGRGGLQRAMIAVEVALSVVLLVGTGLLTRSLDKLSVVDAGFRPDHLLDVRLALDAYREAGHMRAFYMNAFSELSSLPGVVGVTGMSNSAFSGGHSSSMLLLPGESDASIREHRHEVRQHIVGDNFFATMGIAVLAGRPFTGEDRSGGPLVAVLSESAARRDFPTESAIGKRVKFHEEWYDVAGIVRDVKVTSLSGRDEPTIYTPFSQHPQRMDLVVRTSADPAPMARSVRDALQRVAPEVAITAIDDVPSLIRRSFSEERFRAALMTLFACIAATLAAIGMYGVTSRAVARRAREVGIRIALGATTRSVVAMIVNQTLIGVAAGALAGAGAALLASRVLVPYLFGVTARDPMTYGVILGLVAIVSVLASWWPAQRAGRVEPASVLRAD